MIAQNKSNLTYTFDFYKEMSHYDMSYIYNGSFSQAITDDILSLAETNMDQIGESSKIQKRVYFIMVESLQNITRHVETSDSKASVEVKEVEGVPSFFIIQRLNNEYIITSGNIIENTNVNELTSKLDKVNSLDPESLKNYSKQILETGELTNKGGAGLGLIEMARKSGNKLIFDFNPIDQNTSFFYFQIKVSSGLNSTVSMDDYKRFLSSKKLHQQILQNDIKLIFQGEFNDETVKTVLSMAEANIALQENVNYHKNVFSIIVEMLHNINQHTSAIDIEKGNLGVFFIGKDGDDNYEINSSNLIANTNIPAFEKSLNEINGMTVNELAKQVELKSQNTDTYETVGRGLGLAQMRACSKSPIAYEISPYNDNHSLISLKVVAKE